MKINQTVGLTVNRQVITKPIEGDRVLVDFLREDLNLTGTHIGCDTVSCGACTVLINGEPIKSCSILTMQCTNQEIRTVEGLAEDEELSLLQQQFRSCFALQCGFCTPGFLMIGTYLVEQGKRLDHAQIAEQIKGNFCRCTGFTPIIEAIYQTIHNQGET